MNSQRILILTNPDDEHAFLVAHALRLKGAEPRLCQTSDFPSTQSVSVRLDDRNGARGGLHGPSLDVALDWPDVIWRRRPVAPVIPAAVDPLDREFAGQEAGALAYGLWRLWSEHAFWINPPEASSRSRLKLYQHQVAVNVGLTVPDTLYSNDPEEIRNFIETRPSGCVYKTLAFPGVWRTADGGGAFSYTSRLTVEDLPEPDLLRAVPGIYQDLVPKAFELRVTVMGSSVFAAALDSQETSAGRLDWRRGYHELTVRPFDLPDETAELCKRLLHELGLVFGCFDLIATPDGELVFLEVNEMGQFLWVEDMGELPLLDAFCDFLLSGDATFRYTARTPAVRATDLWPHAREAMNDAKRLHVVSPREIVDEGAEPAATDVLTAPPPL